MVGENRPVAIAESVPSFEVRPGWVRGTSRVFRCLTLEVEGAWREGGVFPVPLAEGYKEEEENLCGALWLWGSRGSDSALVSGSGVVVLATGAVWKTGASDFGGALSPGLSPAASCGSELCLVFTRESRASDVAVAERTRAASVTSVSDSLVQKLPSKPWLNAAAGGGGGGGGLSGILTVEPFCKG